MDSQFKDHTNHPKRHPCILGHC